MWIYFERIFDVNVIKQDYFLFSYLRVHLFNNTEYFQLDLESNITHCPNIRNQLSILKYFAKWTIPALVFRKMLLNLLGSG